MPAQTPAKMSGKSAKTNEVIIPDFKGGVNTYLDEARRPLNTLGPAVNFMLKQDGVLSPRWGTKTYGVPFDSMPDGVGTFTETVLGALVQWRIAVINGVLYKSLNRSDWTEVPGQHLTPGHEVKFLQIDNRVYMANGHDRLAYMDIAANQVFVFVPINAPGTVSTSISGSSLSTGSYPNYYKVSAVNDVGETIASTGSLQATNRQRFNWRQTDEYDDFISLSWSAVSGAKRYNIYYSDISGDEVYIDSVSTNSYTDTGRAAQNVAVEAPIDDTTGGPVLRDISASSYRIFGIGVDDRVYWGGVNRFISAFSPFYGGGWIEINKGTGEIPVTVRSYRDGRGEPVNVVFMATVSGEGVQNQLTLTAMTVGNTPFIVPQVARVVGSYGTLAADSVVEAQNNLFFLNSRGEFTTGAKPDLLNVLSTDEVSLAIRPDIYGISNKCGKSASACHFDGKIFLAVPAAGSEINNEIWILDLQLKTWVRPWLIGIKKLFTYTPDDGQERLMGLLSTPDKDGKYRIVEFGEKYTTDDGVPFVSTFRTSLIHFSKGHQSWAKIKKTYIELLRVNVTGSLSFTVSGTGKKKSLRSLRNFPITTARVTNGFNNQSFNKIMFNHASAGASAYADASTKKVIKINKVVNNFRIEGRSSNASYSLAGLTTEVEPRRVPDPSSWKK